MVRHSNEAMGLAALPAGAEGISALAIPQQELPMTVTIGAGLDSRFEATLPLSAAERSLATEQQRVRIADVALAQILAENPEKKRLGFGLRDELVERTGLNDAAVLLALYAREKELEEL